MIIQSEMNLIQKNIDNKVLRLNKIETTNQLEEILEFGIVELYQDSFKDYPYYEKFSKSEVISKFNDYLNYNAQFYTVQNQEDRVIALAVGYTINQDVELEKYLKDICQSSQTLYMAEACVAKDYRRKGINRWLDEVRFEGAKNIGCTTAIVRTNPDNYKKIAGILKGGGKVISSVRQEIAQKRADGKIRIDERVFYQFDLNKVNKPDTVLSKVVITRPGGNDTAIVFDKVSRNQQKKIDKAIRANYTGVEQVMFLEEHDGEAYGQMAGGELCGNATRSLGYLLLNQETGQRDLRVSGTEKTLAIKVTGNNAQTEIPIYNDFEKITSVGEGLNVVEMDGITHMVAEPNSQTYQNFFKLIGKKNQDAFILNELEKYDLKKYDAAGIMFVDYTELPISMEPYVFVSSSGSIYYETACGSGTTAVGMLLSKRNKTNVNLPIIQPSGKQIEVSVMNNGSSFEKATINGEIQVVFEARMPLVFD